MNENLSLSQKNTPKANETVRRTSWFTLPKQGKEKEEEAKKAKRRPERYQEKAEATKRDLETKEFAISAERRRKMEEEQEGEDQEEEEEELRTPLVFGTLCPEVFRHWFWWEFKAQLVFPLGHALPV